ncbi:MAG: hypothetical protein HFJ58_04620 [Clostridia bacterium]|nr:hypothetical protein [Clostridia bacterium]
MNNTEKTIIFVPRTAGLGTYHLSEAEVERLLDALEGDCAEIAPRTGIYTISSLDKVADAYHNLSMKE